MFEEEFESIEEEIKKVRGVRNKVELKEDEMQLILKYAGYLMEHPKDLLVDRDNMLNQRQMFGTVFEELPTYDNLVNGTAKLQPIFQLKANEDLSKS